MGGDLKQLKKRATSSRQHIWLILAVLFFWTVLPSVAVMAERLKCRAAEAEYRISSNSNGPFILTLDGDRILLDDYALRSIKRSPFAEGLYLFTRSTGAVELVSVLPDGSRLSSLRQLGSPLAKMSDDGRFIAFQRASDSYLYLRDISTQHTSAFLFFYNFQLSGDGSALSYEFYGDNEAALKVYDIATASYSKVASLGAQTSFTMSRDMKSYLLKNGSTLLSGHSLVRNIIDTTVVYSTGDTIAYSSNDLPIVPPYGAIRIASKRKAKSGFRAYYLRDEKKSSKPLFFARKKVFASDISSDGSVVALEGRSVSLSKLPPFKNQLIIVRLSRDDALCLRGGGRITSMTADGSKALVLAPGGDYRYRYLRVFDLR